MTQEVPEVQPTSTSVPPEELAAQEPERGDAPGPSMPSPGGRVVALAPWILAVLALALAGYAIFEWQQLAAQERAREDVVAATARFLTELTTWDASDGMDDTRQALLELGTDNLAADVEQLYGASDEMAALREINAASTSTFEGVYVQRLQGDRAEVFAVVVQRVTTDESSDVEVTVRYAQVGLVQTGGEWKVDQLDLLVDTLGPDGQPRDNSITIPGDDAETQP